MKDFGTLIFGYAEMEAYLPENVYQKFLKIKNDEELLDKETADTIAKAMKEWAISKGATHYTHWFQPLTGSTAEVIPIGIILPLSLSEIQFYVYHQFLSHIMVNHWIRRDHF